MQFEKMGGAGGPWVALMTLVRMKTLVRLCLSRWPRFP